MEARVRFPDELQTGERLWLGDGRNPKRLLVRVVKTTPTQIIATLGNIEKRYHRKTGREVGGTFSSFLTSVATQPEIAEFEIEQRKQSAERDRQTAERQKIEDKLTELLNLFEDYRTKSGHGVSISRDGEEWELTLYGLSESQIRQLSVVMTNNFVAKG